MARTKVQLENNTLLLLDEASNTTIADLATGSGGSATIATLAVIDRYIDEGAARLCRSCYLLPGTGTASYATGQRVIGLHDLTGQMERSASADGSLVWACLSVVLGTNYLERTDMAALTLMPGWETTANGTPLVWADMGQSIRLWPAPSAGATLTVQGFVTPPSISSVTFTWMPDDLAEAVELYAALQVAMKVSSDETMRDKIPVLMQRFDGRCANLWQKMTGALRDRFCPVAPTFLSVAAQAG